MLTVYYRNNAAILKNPLCVPTPQQVDHRDYVKVCHLEGGLESVFREMNVVDGDELPVVLKVRSMMTGDVVVDADGNAWLCAMVGWERVEWRWGRKPE